jgi:sulfate adenylyltransferase
VIDTEQHEPEESAALVVAKLEELGLVPAEVTAVSVTETTQLIEPHGGKLVDRTGSRPDGVEQLEQLALTPRELSDLDMLASGALSPLEGFMARHDYESVVDGMRLANGLPWALPVCLAVDREPEGDQVALTDCRRQRARRARRRRRLRVRQGARGRALLPHHRRRPPGVKRLYDQKPYYLAGRVSVFERAEPAFPGARHGSRRDPRDLRRARGGSAWSASRRATRSIARTST